MVWLTESNVRPCMHGFELLVLLLQERFMKAGRLARSSSLSVLCFFWLINLLAFLNLFLVVDPVQLDLSKIIKQK